MVQGLPYCTVGQQHRVLQRLARARGRAVEGGVGLGFGVWGLGFGVWGLGLGFGVWDYVWFLNQVSMPERS